MIIKFIAENTKELKNIEKYKFVTRFETVMRSMGVSDKIVCKVEKSKTFDKGKGVE